MASISNTNICGLCSLRQITKTSKNWCQDCEEAICDECVEHHKVLKATRSHELITISKYNSLPLFITNIQQSCIYHNEHYLQYCVEHALPICFKCIKDHQKCTVIPLDEVIYNAKTSEQFQDIETRLVDLVQNIDRIKTDRRGNLARIEQIKKRHVKYIQQIRIKINTHLDQLENEIIKDLEEKEGLCKENIQKILPSVNEKESMIKECQANFQSLKQDATNLQTFLGIREIESMVSKHEQYLQSLLETKRLEQIDLVCKVNQDVSSILNSLEIFGSIEIKTRAMIIEFTRAKDPQAQLQVTPRKRSIYDFNLILHRKITTGGKSAVRGCCMSVNEDCFFIDHATHQTMNVIASDGTFKYYVSIHPSWGLDITFVEEKTVAVSSGDSATESGIYIIDINGRSIKKFIQLPGRSFGITRDGDSLFVCVVGFGIYSINTVNYTISRVISLPLTVLSYVSVFNDQIIYTDKDEDSVVCYDRNGSKVWTFKDCSILKCPTCITEDSFGNVYVVGEKSANVVIISKDGKHHKQILTSVDGILKPSAIYFDKQKRQLLAANIKKTACLYYVVYSN